MPGQRWRDGRTLGLFKGRRGGPLDSEQWGVTLLAGYLLLHGEPVNFRVPWGGLGKLTSSGATRSGARLPEERTQTLVYCMWV